MMSSSALARTKQQPREVQFALPADGARAIAHTWMDVACTEDVLATLAENRAGIIAWHAAPAVQNAVAAMASEAMGKNDAVICIGFQAYGWMQAAGYSSTDIAATYLGKKLPTTILSMTAEDTIAAVTAKKTSSIIIAMHIEDAAQWNDVRALSAAAVKSEVPMMLIVSAAVPAPEGVIIENMSINSMDSFAEVAVAVKDATLSVREQGAICVLSFADTDAASIERAMMEAAAMTPDIWAETLQKNIDGAQIAVNSAYQAPVEYL